MSAPFYITTPIYYVNDRPHIGHLYTTTVADVIARHARQAGRDVFFLTGTDEHASKVADAAAEKGLTPLAWADQNAAAFSAWRLPMKTSQGHSLQHGAPRLTKRLRASQWMTKGHPDALLSFPQEMRPIRSC